MSVDVNIGAAASFQLRELTGPKRTITLTTRALPYRPFTLKGTQRVETTWYPGNPEGTGTVLGASEEATTVTGKWKDLFLASGPGGIGGTQLTPIMVDGRQVTTAKDAIKLFDDVRRMGQEIEVTWDEITRRGYLKSLEQSWDNIHDVAWTIEFEWISQGEATVPVVLDGGSTSDTNAQLDAQREAMDVAAVPPFAVPPTFASALAAALESVSVAVANAVNAGSVQATGATSPGDAARRVFASTNDIVIGTSTVIGVCEARPPRALIPGGDPASVAIDMLPLGQIVAAETYVREAEIATRKLARTAAIRRAALARTLDNDLIGVWIASEGDDLRDVAAAFYGSRLQWRQLLLFNELTSTRLSRGQMVLVPRASANPAGVS